MPSIRFTFDRSGIRNAALRSPAVRAELRRIGEQIAARAESLDSETGDTSPKSKFLVDDGGERRARVYVQALGEAAGAREAKYRILGRSLDGGDD